MLKRWRSLALSVLLPCCMCLMLFLDTLHVEAANSMWDLLDGSTDYINTTAQSFSLQFCVDGDLSALSLGSGTYSGTSSGTYSGESSGSASSSSITGGSTGTYSTSNIHVGSSVSGSVTMSTTSSSSTNFRGTFNGTSLETDGTATITGASNISGSIGSQSISTDDSGSLSSDSSGTISFSSSSSGSINVHCKLPIDLHFARNGTLQLNPNDYYGFYALLGNVSANNGTGRARNIVLTDCNGYILNVAGTNMRQPKFDVGSNFLCSATGTYKYGIYGYLEFDYVLNNYSGSDVFTMSFTVTPNIRRVKDDYQASVGASVVSDTVAHEIQQSTLESSQAIEESVTSETGTGLLATIKNFFGSFFSNIINSFISLFVPSSDYFSTWFENLNDLLSEKLGMLYAPFDFIISILNSVYSADTSEPSIPFPAITWDGTTLVSAQNLKFSELLGDNYSTLQGYVYFGTDTVLLFAFLYLLQRKIALILTGSEANG